MPSVEVFYSINEITKPPKPKSITTIGIAFMAMRYRSTNIVSVPADTGCAIIVRSLIIGMADHYPLSPLENSRLPRNIDGL